jgi:hypothetical protein
VECSPIVEEDEYGVKKKSDLQRFKGRRDEREQWRGEVTYDIFDTL